MDDEDRGRFAELGVIADFQLSASTLSSGYRNLLAGQLGAARVDGLIPIASLVAAGARVVLSSDWDADPLAPFAALERGLTRRQEGLPGIAEGLRMMTIDAAFLLRQESRVGSFAVGKLADLIVLDRDLFEIPTEQISETEVLLTLLAGSEVHRADGF